MTDNRPSRWLNQALRQAPWRSQTQATSLTLAGVVIVVVIGALYLAQASRTAAAGRRLQEMDGQRQVLEQQNAQLRAEIASLRSVPALIARAEQLGYHAASSRDVEYLAVPGAPPAPITPTPPSDSTELVAAYDETLASWLTDQLASFRAGFQSFWDSNFGPERAP